MIKRHTTKLFTVIVCFLLLAMLCIPVSQAVAYRQPLPRGGGAMPPYDGYRTPPYPPASHHYGPTASPSPIASPTGTDMVDLSPDNAIEISPGQIKDIKGITGQSISGQQPGAKYYQATGRVRVPQSIITSSLAEMASAKVGGKKSDRSTCIVLNSVQWYMETAQMSDYGGMLCYFP